VVRHDNADDRHQMYGVARDVRAYPVVVIGEGRRERCGCRPDWRSHFGLGHVDETVEVMTPLRPQLWPSIHTWRVVEDDLHGCQGPGGPSDGATGLLLVVVRQASCHCAGFSASKTCGLPLHGRDPLAG
jgi:hypothetical protein